MPIGKILWRFALWHGFWLGFEKVWLSPEEMKDFVIVTTYLLVMSS